MENQACISASRLALWGGCSVSFHPCRDANAHHLTPTNSSMKRRTYSESLRSTETCSLVAAGGAPVSEMTLRVGGEIVSRVATEWERVRGGWVATARTTMLYRGGKLARSMTTTFDDPHGARIAYSRTPIAAVATLSPPPRPAMDDYGSGTCDRQFYSDPSNCSPFGNGGPCDYQLQMLEDAVTAYWVADVAMIGCYGGPLACAGVTLYLLYTSHQIDVWDSRVDACLAGI